MLGKPTQLQPKLFYNSFSLEQRVHEGHPLRKVKNIIEFSFIRSEVKDLYGYSGNQSINPDVMPWPNTFMAHSTSLRACPELAERACFVWL